MLLSVNQVLLLHLPFLRPPSLHYFMATWKKAYRPGAPKEKGRRTDGPALTNDIIKFDGRFCLAGGSATTDRNPRSVRDSFHLFQLTALSPLKSLLAVLGGAFFPDTGCLSFNNFPPQVFRVGKTNGSGNSAEPD